MFNYLSPRRFEKMFDDFFSPSFVTTNTNMNMKTDIIEKENEYILEMELAGYNKDDVKLSLDDGYLKVEAHKTVERDDSTDKVVHRERFYGSQSRSFYVGNVDQEAIQAKFNDGILVINVPKKQLKLEDKTKYISIE
ncbi:MAG: Hsp20/alpha crystallin family protein [Erysipelotrichia bacterium]|nr:Hsp20/alpha crystallin family protein [Erysipelotrichia bacterium]